jgi:hypothetical protein
LRESTEPFLEPQPTLTHPHIINQIIEFSQDALPEESAYTNVGTWFVPKVWYECDFEAAQIREVAPGTLSLCVVKIAATEQLDLGVHSAVAFLQSLNALRARRELPLPNIQHVELVVMLPLELATAMCASSQRATTGEPADRVTPPSVAPFSPTIVERVAGFELLCFCGRNSNFLHGCSIRL